MRVVSNKALEEEVETLKEHFGAIVTAVKDLRCTVEDLKKNILPMENEEIKEILETHKVIDEVVVANSDAIKQID